MKGLVFVSVLGAVTAFSFSDFLAKYNKQYASADEHARREAIFNDNVVKAARYQALNPEASFGHTKFMDLTKEEFKRMYAGGKPRTEAKADGVLDLPDVIPAMPTSVDWRTKGVVTPVKDQGQCGSCWAFSTVEEIESMWAMAGNKLETFSTQQIVSCDKGTANWTDSGCDGGFTEGGYDYVKKAGGLESESSYPYKSGTGITGSCKFDSSKIAGGHVRNFYYATPACYRGGCAKQNETALQYQNANVGPISVCLNAEPWQSYDGGIMTQATCPARLNDVDHCVQLVGYNEEGSKPYWIVRNSWNTDWGIDGYIHLSMKENTCGIMDDATVPRF